MRVAVCLALCLFSSSLFGQVRMPRVFTNDMVLQRGMPVPVWGTASNGEIVTVVMAGQTVSTKAANGRWSLRLKALPAGGPYKMTIQGKNLITLRNVMVGEVWICSGQSNMVWKLRATTTGASAIKTSGQWGIRLYTSGMTSPWRICGSTTSPNFSAVAFFFAREMSKTLKVPIGLIQAARGGTAVSTWQPGGVNYKSRVAPLVPFALRGALWYQGESDARNTFSYVYGSRFRSLIRSWRSQWGQARFPFLYVQLPRYRKKSPYWMHIREAQLETLALPDTAMTILMDLPAVGIHPKNKLQVGLRLAHAALNKVYGQGAFVPSGPIYDPGQTRIIGSQVQVGFREATGGLASSWSKLLGFELAGSNLVYAPASARVVGSKVLVTSKYVARPVAVRYGWAVYPTCTLVNGSGLPASPFRSFARYEAVGKGCGASLAPKLEVTLLPRRARPFELQLSDCPAKRPGVVLTGFSDTQWGALKLPFGLNAVGMGSCKLYSSGEFLDGFVTDAWGKRAFRITLPNLLALHGVQLFNQGFVSAPRANTLGVIATNGGKGRIGPP